MIDIVQQDLNKLLQGELFWILAVAFFVLMWLVQLFYYLFFYSRILFYKRGVGKAKIRPVSIVIAARDEKRNLERFLPAILNQDYPDFEVIVVNDSSSDNSAEFLEKLSEKYQNLYITHIPKDQKFRHGKKLALTVGIKAAKNEWLLFSDADCMVPSDKWLQIMQRNFVDKADVVLGYGGYLKRKWSLLNMLIRFDTLFIALQYFTFAMAKMPYMGVGRNLAYRKSVFLRNKGFARHYSILSGSDDLLVNEIATAHNVRVELEPESFTYSLPKETLWQWLGQKRRHTIASKKYKTTHKLLLGGEYFSRLFFYGGMFAMIAFPDYWPYFVALYGFRFLIQTVIFAKASRTFKEYDLLMVWFLFDIFVAIFLFFIGIVNLIRPKVNKWK